MGDEFVCSSLAVSSDRPLGEKDVATRQEDLSLLGKLLRTTRCGDCVGKTCAQKRQPHLTVGVSPDRVSLRKGWGR